MVRGGAVRVEEGSCCRRPLIKVRVGAAGSARDGGAAAGWEQVGGKLDAGGIDREDVIVGGDKMEDLAGCRRECELAASGIIRVQLRDYAVGVAQVEPIIIRRVGELRGADSDFDGRDMVVVRARPASKGDRISVEEVDGVPRASIA